MSTGADGVNVEQQTTAVRKTVASYTYQRSVYEVHQEFNQLDPQAISDACRAWKRAADELLALADGLKTQAAAPLSAAWTSPASPWAQEQLRQAEATARALASDCMQMAHATDYAAQYAQWYKDNLPSYTDSLASGAKGLVTGQGLAGGAEAATQHLVNLLGRYNEVIQAVPPSVQKGLVVSRDAELPPPPPPPPPRGGSGGVGGPHLSGLGSHVPGASGLGPSVSGHAGLPTGTGPGIGSGADLGSGGGGSGIGSSGGIGSGDPYAAGSSLAGTGLGGGVSGFDPNALGSGASGAAGPGGLGGGLGAALGAGALGATGLGAGGLAGGLGSGRAGSGLSGAGGVGSMGGPGGALAGEEAAGAGAGRGTGMMPMHGAGGQGEGEEERQRSTWLLEDDDVWGTGGDVPPPVITS